MYVWVGIYIVDVRVCVCVSICINENIVAMEEGVCVCRYCTSLQRPDVATDQLMNKNYPPGHGNGRQSARVHYTRICVSKPNAYGVRKEWVLY